MMTFYKKSIENTRTKHDIVGMMTIRTFLVIHFTINELKWDFSFKLFDTFLMLDNIKLYTNAIRSGMGQKIRIGPTSWACMLKIGPGSDILDSTDIQFVV